MRKKTVLLLFLAMVSFLGKTNLWADNFLEGKDWNNKAKKIIGYFLDEEGKERLSWAINEYMNKEKQNFKGLLIILKMLLWL